MTELKVVDITSRRTLSPGEIGEICFRCPAVMRGYYKRPEDTAEVFEDDGWCKTGDAGYYDESGRFYFVQRLKELIKCMDNQVVPAELEGLLLQEFAENISEVVVLGLDHPELGQAPAAAVLLKEKTHGAGDLTDLAERMKATIAQLLYLPTCQQAG
ncbi:luciferin 4-monooxygenase-like [Rhipicephalus sanguineus]|uniref:luciferin 4-monooxygenase-like n=1 Tax=Rhipicephalus sanguineus TaxID=34632 RepID=UPI0018953803|nr:luciferin 4-monooxygenase-like [Rhipicephalus sanguineus]